MGFYGERILPRLVDRTCGTSDVMRRRAHVTAGLSGVVLEVGFGSGLNLASLPAEVTKVLAVEPSTGAGRLAGERIEASAIPVEHVGLDGASIALADGSCDSALSTFTLCTIPDVDAALSEIYRVLKPGGRFHLLEHGLADDAKVARWQRRLDPIEQRVAGGCHLTRDPTALVERAGFVVDRSSSAFAPGPKPWTWLTEAVVHKP